MLIDRYRGAEIERAVRSAYQWVLRDRWLDEDDIECMEMAIDKQVTIFILDALLKRGIVLSEPHKTIFAQATGILDLCLSALEIKNPYGGGRPN